MIKIKRKEESDGDENTNGFLVRNLLGMEEVAMKVGRGERVRVGQG